MRLYPNCNEEFVPGPSVNETGENGDFMMLDELYRQEDSTLIFESIQVRENELPNLAEMNYTDINQFDSNFNSWNEDFAFELSNDSGFSSDQAFSSSFLQENSSCENSIQFSDDVHSTLNVNYNSIENQPLLVDCASNDYNNIFDFGEFDESQIESILTKYFTSINSCLDDPIKTVVPDDEPLLLNAKVYLERLPESIVQQVTKTKVKSVGVITDKKSHFNGRRNNVKPVQRYCYKCKKFETGYTNVSLPKICPDCGCFFIYLCSKCKQKYFITYSAMALHRKVCRFNNKSNNVSTPAALRCCSDCNFETLHQPSMTRHLAKTKHRYDGDMQVGVKEEAGCIIKQSHITFKRFCKRCNKSVSSSNSMDNELCKQCRNQLFYLCVKCGLKSKSYKSITYHLKRKCLPRRYECLKCEFTTNKWKFMHRHSKTRHPNVMLKFNCEHCNYKTNYKSTIIEHLAYKHGKVKILYCKLCDKYSTTVASCLKKHVLVEHSEKKVKYRCDICLRYTTYDKKNLQNHVQQMHSKK